MTAASGTRPTTALVADDEALARRRIVELLEGRDSIRIVGECASGPATLDAVRELAPDLLFLDVQMPGLDGFEVLARLEPEERPIVVFSTAYDEYAIQAFEVNAVDYLLKPYADERFDESVRRAEQSLRRGREERASERLRDLLDRVAPDFDENTKPSSRAGRYLDRFAIRVRDRWVVARASAVDWIEASGDYVTLHVGDKTYLLRSTMSSLEARLNPRYFLRIHRSTIVRLDCVRSVEAGEHGDYTVLLEGGRKLRVSRGYRDAVLERLGLRW